MHEQRVLRCPQCQKPFDQASTLKRHGYYCRSRQTGTAPRHRSCLSCAQGKARCNNGRPKCSRCIGKGIECQYPTRSPGGALPRATSGYLLHLGHESPPEDQPVVSTLGIAEATYVPNDHGGAGPSQLTQLPLSGNSAQNQLGWDDNFDFSQVFDQHVFDGARGYPISTSSTTGNPPSLWADPSSTMLGRTTSFPGPSVYLSPQEPQRTLTHRPKSGKRAYRIAHVLFQSLKAYPIMMGDHGSWPPIIHPGTVSLNADNEDMEPLNNCMSLLRMLHRGAQGSQKLFWSNVRRECESFCATYNDMNKWKLLAVQQALFIYVIARLDQGETEHNNLDILLRTTVMEVSTRVKAIYREHASRPGIAAQSWTEWIYLESLRRLCSIYKILNMLVCFDAAALCNLQPDLLVAPLPTEKRLWEAPDAVAWQREYEKKADLPVEFGLATNGELVKMGRDEVHLAIDGAREEDLGKDVPSRSTADLAEWFSEMDGLGGLVMVAASAIE